MHISIYVVQTYAYVSECICVYCLCKILKKKRKIKAATLGSMGTTRAGVGTNSSLVTFGSEAWGISGAKLVIVLYVVRYVLAYVYP